MMIGVRAAIQGVTIQVHAEIQDRGGRSGHTAVIRPYNPLLIASRRCSAASWFGICPQESSTTGCVVLSRPIFAGIVVASNRKSLCPISAASRPLRRRPGSPRLSGVSCRNHASTWGVGVGRSCSARDPSESSSFRSFPQTSSLTSGQSQWVRTDYVESQPLERVPTVRHLLVPCPPDRRSGYVWKMYHFKELA
jgi:hypothetical protein